MTVKIRWLLVMGFICSLNAYSQDIYAKKVLLMGSDFEIKIVANIKQQGHKYLDMAIKEIERIDALISSWISNSQTSKVNKMAYNNPVKVDKELFDLIKRSVAISKLTDGAFDITYVALAPLWRFEGKNSIMPDAETLKEHIATVGYKYISLDDSNTTITLLKKGVKINLGGIGKGYAADKAKELLQKNNVKAGVINASGDISAWGVKPDGKAWTVGITNPFDIKKSYGIFPIIDSAVVTSGNYRKYCIIDGKRHSHIIDPRTGMPTTGITSVTVFASKAELADALATSIFVMGIDTGIHRINQIKNVDCIIVDINGQLHYSNKIVVDNFNINKMTKVK